MRNFIGLIGALTFAGLTGPTWAQNTIQQPVFSFNTVTTTVTAPDGGTIGLGGVKRASSGRTERGVPILGKMPYLGRLFNNRGIGQDYSHSYQSVTPRIIILEEEDEKLGLGDFSSGAPIGGVLSSSAMRNYVQPRELSAVDHQALRLSQHVSRNVQRQNFEPTQPVGPTAEEIRQRNETASQTRSSEAVKFFEKAQAAEQAGKANVAKIYYEMVTRRASGQLKDAAFRRLQVIESQQ